LPRPPQARLAKLTTARSPLLDEPGWATHTPKPNFGKVEYFQVKGLTETDTGKLHHRHPEVLASSASLEGRRPGCIGAVHPSRLPMRRAASHVSRLRMTELARVAFIVRRSKVARTSLTPFATPARHPPLSSRPSARRSSHRHAAGGGRRN
ncbi:hypothetical protein D6B98_28700, partial [Bradyrhizobium sp. LVM 105]